MKVLRVRQSALPTANCRKEKKVTTQKVTKLLDYTAIADRLRSNRFYRPNLLTIGSSRVLKTTHI